MVCSCITAYIWLPVTSLAFLLHFLVCVGFATIERGLLPHTSPQKYSSRSVSSLPYDKMVITFFSRFKLTNGQWIWKEYSMNFHLASRGLQNSSYSRNYACLKFILVKSYTKTRLIEIFSTQLCAKCFL